MTSEQTKYTDQAEAAAMFAEDFFDFPALAAQCSVHTTAEEVQSVFVNRDDPEALGNWSDTAVTAILGLPGMDDDGYYRDRYKAYVEGYEWS